MYIHLPILSKVFRAALSRDRFDRTHATWVTGLSVAFVVLRTFVLVCRGLDHLLFPRFRRQGVQEPVYIIGNPRSGTTFLHRLMSLDRRFSTMSLFETIMPSISLYYVSRGARLLDNHIGQPVRRMLASMTSSAFGAWSGIHRTRLSEPEEDEQLLVYTLVTPVLTLLFPFFDEIKEWDYADQLEPRARHRLMRHYLQSIQRHLFVAPNDKTLLVKNTSISGRLRCTFEAMPDMKVVHLVRHPFETIASLLSMYTATWSRLVPQVFGDVHSNRSLAYLFCDYYRYRLEALRDIPKSQVVHVSYEDLVSDPKATVRRVYTALGLEMDPDFVKRLEEETRRADTYVSTHHYSLEQFGLTESEIRDRLQEVFQEYGFDDGCREKSAEFEYATS